MSKIHKLFWYDTLDNLLLLYINLHVHAVQSERFVILEPALPALAIFAWEILEIAFCCLCEGVL